MLISPSALPTLPLPFPLQKLASDGFDRSVIVDVNTIKLQKWKKAFEDKNGRPPTKADLMMADSEIKALAQRYGGL